MSKFKVEVVPVHLEKHPNADVLSLIRVGGWNVCSGTAQWEGHDRGAYVPIDAIVPFEKIKEWDMLDPKNPERGLFNGPKGDRVGTKKLRGIVSQGFLIPVDNSIPLGTDLAEEWGIIKYEPPILFVNDGVSTSWPPGLKKYDVERYENYPTVLRHGETVVATEKLDGTNAAFDLRNVAYSDMVYTVCSRNIAFDPNDPRNAQNMYVRVFEDNQLRRRLGALVEVTNAACSVTIRGEIVGPGIQGNVYKLAKIEFYVFDIEVDDKPVSFDNLLSLCKGLELNPVPKLFVGHWSPDNIPVLAYGPSKLNPDALREGAVWKPIQERETLEIGRVMVKTVDPEYLIKVDKRLSDKVK